MPRRPTFDTEQITKAIQSIIAAGEPVNVQRVRTRLGGGNASRIKSLIAATSRTAGRTAQNSDAPFAEVERLASALVDAVRAAAQEFPATKSPVTDRRHPQSHGPLAATEQKLADAEAQCAEAMRQRDNLRMALRNAEVDLQTTKRAHHQLERNRAQDQEEIATLHRRIADLESHLRIVAGDGGRAAAPAKAVVTKPKKRALPTKKKPRPKRRTPRGKTRRRGSSRD